LLLVEGIVPRYQEYLNDYDHRHIGNLIDDSLWKALEYVREEICPVVRDIDPDERLFPVPVTCDYCLAHPDADSEEYGTVHGGVLPAPFIGILFSTRFDCHPDHAEYSQRYWDRANKSMCGELSRKVG
jgi:hypothetical protein